jgi:hypothetical protein
MRTTSIAIEINATNLRNFLRIAFIMEKFLYLKKKIQKFLEKLFTFLNELIFS